MINTKLTFNQQAFFPSTIPLKISDTQIKKHMRDQRVRQLKDIRCSLYLRFNAERTGGTWWFYRYEDGKQFPYRVGKYPATQAKDIMALISATSVLIANEKDIECNRFETVDQLIQWHVQRQFKLNRSSKARLQNLKCMSDLHLTSIFHGQPISTLDYQTLDRELIQPMFEQGYSVSYVRAHFNLIKSAFTASKKLKHLTVNPILEVKFKDFFPETFSVTQAQVKGCRLNNDQLLAVLTAAEQQPPPQRLLLMMILAHGSRIGETRKAKWKNISFIEKCWLIPRDDTKNKQSIVYPLTDDMVELLRSYREWQNKRGYSSDSVFPVSKHSHKPIYGAKASEWIRIIARKEWSAHDLRKRARTIWAELGIDYIVGEALLNHARDKLDQAYIHTHMEKQKREALEAYHYWLKNSWCNCFTPVSTDF